MREQATRARQHQHHSGPLRAPVQETSVSAMNKLSLRMAGAVPGRNVVEMATGTNG